MQTVTCQVCPETTSQGFAELATSRWVSAGGPWRPVEVVSMSHHPLLSAGKKRAQEYVGGDWFCPDHVARVVRRKCESCKHEVDFASERLADLFVKSSNWTAFGGDRFRCPVCNGK